MAHLASTGQNLCAEVLVFILDGLDAATIHASAEAIGLVRRKAA